MEAWECRSVKSICTGPAPKAPPLFSQCLWASEPKGDQGVWGHSQGSHIFNFSLISCLSLLDPCFRVRPQVTMNLMNGAGPAHKPLHLMTPHQSSKQPQEAGLMWWFLPFSQRGHWPSERLGNLFKVTLAGTELGQEFRCVSLDLSWLC